MKKDRVLCKLSELGYIKDVNNVSLRVDEIEKVYLKETYQLRLTISEERSNEEAIKFCKKYLQNIEKCKGKKILSILIRTDDSSRSYFSDENMEIIWATTID